MIVLDINILSELMKAKPAPSVESWVGTQPATSLFTTTINQAEILYGAALLPPWRRRRALEEAVAGMFDEDFVKRAVGEVPPVCQSRLTDDPACGRDVTVSACSPVGV